MRTIQLLIIAYLLTSCQQEKDQLIGHWHSNILEDGSQWTLDITDSTTQLNKYTQGYTFNRFNDEGEEVLFIDFEEVSNFQLNNDTLVINKKLYFTKSEDPVIIEHVFPDLLVQLNLAQSSNQKKIELPKPSRRIHLFVGPPKEFHKSYYYNSDSTCFQTNDFIATGLMDLEYFIQQEDDKLPYTDNGWLIIHADSSTSQATFDTLISVIAPLDMLNGYIVSRYNYEYNSFEYEELTVGNKR